MSKSERNIEFEYNWIKNLKAPDKPIEYSDTGEKGLILRLSKAGTKTFTYRYRSNGKIKRFKIGRFPGKSLSDARKDVRQLRIDIDNGKDPQTDRRNKRYKPKEITFKELSGLFIKQHLSTRKESTRKEYKRIIENELLPKWKSLPVSEITSQYVREILNDKAYKDGSFTMANRIRAVISSIFEFGITRVGLTIERNPVEATAVFEQGENVRDRVYNEDEIKELWEIWETRPEPMQSVYKILLLTGQRLNEVLNMKWTDIEENKPCKRIKIDHEGRAVPEAFLTHVWTVSIEQQKTGRYTKKVHEIPLSEMAYQIIQDLKPLTGKSEYVFESPRKKGFPLNSLNSTDKMIKENVISDFRIHDLRSTFSTKTEESGIEHYIVRKVLNHKDNDTTSRHYTWYDYMDKKLDAMNRWNWRLKNILDGKEETVIHKIG